MLMSAVHPPPSVTSMHSAPTLVGPISVRVKVDTQVMGKFAKVGRMPFIPCLRDTKIRFYELS